MEKEKIKHTQLATPHDYIASEPPNMGEARRRCIKPDEDTIKYQLGNRLMNIDPSRASIYILVQTTRKFDISYGER